MSIQELKVDQEFRSLMPPLTEEEYTLLEQSILAEGLREPILIWNKIIVDGHNRYEICRKYDIKIRTKELFFANREEAMIWIIDNQKGRRNLSKQQKLDMGMKRAKLLEVKAKQKEHERKTTFQKSEKSSLPTYNTTKELAGFAGVSVDTASKYKKIQESDNKEVKEKVREGSMSINRGYQQVREPRHTPQHDDAFVTIDDETVQEEAETEKGNLKNSAEQIQMMEIEKGRSESIVIKAFEVARGKLSAISSLHNRKDAIQALIKKLSDWSKQL